MHFFVPIYVKKIVRFYKDFSPGCLSVVHVMHMAYTHKSQQGILL